MDTLAIWPVPSKVGVPAGGPPPTRRVPAPGGAPPTPARPRWPQEGRNPRAIRRRVAGGSRRRRDIGLGSPIGGRSDAGGAAIRPDGDDVKGRRRRLWAAAVAVA